MTRLFRSSRPWENTRSVMYPRPPSPAGALFCSSIWISLHQPPADQFFALAHDGLPPSLLGRLTDAGVVNRHAGNAVFRPEVHAVRGDPVGLPVLHDDVVIQSPHLLKPPCVRRRLPYVPLRLVLAALKILSAWSLSTLQIMVFLNLPFFAYILILKASVS